MELATRRVHLAACTPNPDVPWMEQIARNLTDSEDGFLNGKRYLLMDRHGEFCESFRQILEGENMLRNAVREFLEHYHGERNHQGLGNVILQPDDEVRRIAGKIQCRERLGGLLNYYYRDAA